tara:strand:- start:1615 stop:1851 length:237 start_codon:yes stop_codon:yes gene_type:complete
MNLEQAGNIQIPNIHEIGCDDPGNLEVVMRDKHDFGSLPYVLLSPKRLLRFSPGVSPSEYPPVAGSPFTVRLQASVFN